ncbi:MAG: hypothetical protein LBP65_02340 [Puniceicoccales bacterium]|jgi:hypothetical protein|nr:hypothetical protein [Puniceicoccales bacterium]
MYQLNDQEVFMDVSDGIAIIINFESGIYHGANLLGTWVLEQLCAGHGQQEILAQIQRLPRCPDDMEERLASFIEDLRTLHILADGGPATNDKIKPPAAKMAKESKFNLTITTYNDAQDLLFADPIHEVDEAEGWLPEKKG